VAFEDNCVQIDKDRPISSATEMFSRDSSFWRYKVNADIPGDSLERRRQTTVGSYVNTGAAHWRSLILFSM